MSLFRYSDYANKKETRHNCKVIQKKVKIPTQHKSPHHKCAHCPRNDATKYQISEKEVRWLCPVCKIKSSTNNVAERPHYLKASKMRIKS